MVQKFLEKAPGVIISIQIVDLNDWKISQTDSHKQTLYFTNTTI